MAVVPVGIVLLWQLVIARHPANTAEPSICDRAGPFSPRGLFCIISLHTSELPLLVFLQYSWCLDQHGKHTTRWRCCGLLCAARRGRCALRARCFCRNAVSFAHGVTERAPSTQTVVENSANWELRVGAILQLLAGPGTAAGLPCPACPRRRGAVPDAATPRVGCWLGRRRPPHPVRERLDEPPGPSAHISLVPPQRSHRPQRGALRPLFRRRHTGRRRHPHHPYRAAIVGNLSDNRHDDRRPHRVRRPPRFPRR